MTTPEPSDAGDFSRVHPLSPFIRGGLVIVAVVGYFFSQQVESLLGAAGSVEPGEGGPESLLLPALAVGATVLGAIGLGLLSWWFTRYRLGDTSLEMHSGAVMRQHRQVRYDRIQTVDLVRPLLARLTGLSEVRVESAGGGDSHVAIAYLTKGDAEAVRVRLLQLAADAQVESPPPGAQEVDGTAGVTADATADATMDQTPVVRPATTPSPDPGVPLLRVPAERLVGSVILGWDTIAFVLVLGSASVGGLFAGGAAVGGVLPVLLVTGGRSLLRVTRWYGLTVAQRGETLTSQRGLTDTRHSSVPLQRVQAIEVRQPLLWRIPGWWSLKVNVAGARIGAASGDDSESVLVPVATTAEVLRLLAAVTQDPATTAEVESLITGTPEGFVPVPSRARWFHPFAAERMGHLAGTRALLIRSGRLDHVVQVVPWGRIQSLTVRQGPLDRRLDLATVDLVSTLGPVRPRAEHLSTTGAAALERSAASRSSHARRGAIGPVGCDPTPDTVDWTR